ncbi:MAG: hypothetical protein MR008_06060 [Aerococcus sp.]|nr:hypothetical protein [Aerococcus sp.]
MSEATDWRLDFLARAKEHVTDYRDVAYLEAAERMIESLNLRIEQAEGELEGLIWNHEEE